ncbi:hypothetical protein CONPUDRAFT_74360 [Coniophora puteana RWD-64-598 SS2]|uniref:Uncharacterized protein n=1 Tax=Coniophora puteana (strain RWD-64-598) TaxID=741705 RepID=A0A5M3MM58_CONPW|nr:uncharacterized protein CONPUDRAFT_74360 [Coniophora puteana RWD-64-598 SS2]EIW80110.1 hypothetical protein CONPUDRAFT_74360 [Coniophora puteana RWD-64-598 SS2]
MSLLTFVLPSAWQALQLLLRRLPNYAMVSKFFYTSPGVGAFLKWYIKANIDTHKFRSKALEVKYLLLTIQGQPQNTVWHHLVKKLIGWPLDKWCNPSNLYGGMPTLQFVFDAIIAGTCKFIQVNNAEVASRKQQIAMCKVLTPDFDCRLPAPAPSSTLAPAPAPSAPATMPSAPAAVPHLTTTAHLATATTLFEQALVFTPAVTLATPAPVPSTPPVASSKPALTSIPTSFEPASTPSTLTPLHLYQLPPTTPESHAPDLLLPGPTPAPKFAEVVKSTETIGTAIVAAPIAIDLDFLVPALFLWSLTSLLQSPTLFWPAKLQPLCMLPPLPTLLPLLHPVPIHTLCVSRGGVPKIQ